MIAEQTGDYLSVSPIAMTKNSEKTGLERPMKLKPQRRRKKKKPATGVRQRLPRDFICIAPAEAMHVYELARRLAKGHEKESAKDQSEEIEETARLHYHLCLRCQETVKRMQLINKAVVNELAKELVHRPETCSGSPVNVADVNNPDLVQCEKQIRASDPGTLFMKAAGDV